MENVIMLYYICWVVIIYIWIVGVVENVNLKGYFNGVECGKCLRLY